MNDESFLVALTHADMIELQRGGTITVNPKDIAIGLPDLKIIIFLGGTHAQMAALMAKHPEAKGKFIESHENKN